MAIKATPELLASKDDLVVPGPIQTVGHSFLYQLDVSDGKNCNLWGGSLHTHNGYSPTHLHKAVQLFKAAPQVLTALEALLEHYVALINSGDAGRWDPETEASVIGARAAIAATKLPIN